jgi:5-methylthioadenosine/S-adenosylhomocysteine deaminase
MKRTFLRHAIVLTIDAADSYYADGCIIVEDGLIAYVGTEAQRPEIQEGDAVIDLHGKLVMPGLVNTHIHSHSPLFRNFGEDVALQTWLNAIMWPAESHLTEEQAYFAALHTCIESISSGVTTFADQFYFAPAVARAVNESGMRAVLCTSIFEDGRSDRFQTVRTAEEFVGAWQGRNPLVVPGLGPHAPYSVSEEQWRQVVELSKSYGVLVHTHISETEKENKTFHTRYSLSPTQWLEKLGVFECPTLAAHCVHLSDEDIAILRNNDVHVSYNPVSNLKLVSGIMPYERLVGQGVQVSLGTDGAQSNNTLDLLGDLKTGVLIQKQRTGNPAFLTVSDAVRLATIAGALALGLDNVTGSLETGKQADLIAIDIRQPHLRPLHVDSVKMLYTALVYCATGRDVVDTMVRGRWLMRDRELLSLDAASILHRTDSISRLLRAQAGLTRD